MDDNLPPFAPGERREPRNMLEEEDKRVIDELNRAAAVLDDGFYGNHDPASLSLPKPVTSAKRRETVTVPDGMTTAEDPNFRWERDEHGRPRQVHVGMNRKQRRIHAKQQELELRRRLKAISKDPAKVKELARRLSAAAG